MSSNSFASIITIILSKRKCSITSEVANNMYDKNRTMNRSLLLFMIFAGLISVLTASIAFADETTKAPHAGGSVPVVLAFFCPSEEIGYIGELLFPLTILENSKVKADLDITDAQLAKMKEADKAFLDGIKDVLNRNVDKGGGVRMEDHIIAIGKLAEDARQRSNDILKSHKVDRLREILLQTNGLLSIPKKDIRQVLRLEREQERKVDEIKARIFRKIDETSPQAPGAKDRCRFVVSTSQEVARALVDGNKAIAQLLTPEQKEQVEKLKGKLLPQ